MSRVVRQELIRFAPVYQHTPAASLWHARAQDCYLAYFLTELAGATAIIFARTCDGARKLALLLRNLGELTPG